MFASRVRLEHTADCRVALIGLADDTGVRLNNGRPGAAAAPGAFRAALSRYGVAEPDGFEWPIVYDAGDVLRANPDRRDDASLHETHRRVTEAVAAILELGMFPIAIGGGHDLTFPFVRAVTERRARRSLPPLAGLYFDAHLDVRPTVGSGMPFRRLIEHCRVGPLLVHGLNPLANAREMLAWFTGHDGRVIDAATCADVRGIAPEVGDCFASFDVDVVDAAFAPGVSALNPCGWTPELSSRWCEALGADQRVQCFDLMEFNPTTDEGGRTARLVAHLFLCFLRGFARR
ncbi:MAG: arginase family protein [Planctomycetota bacterium]|nr:arginase family protein [Planctomycetota bacterium]